MSKVLIIDNEPGMRQVIERILVPQGYEIFSADDGSQAIENVSDIDPGLILLDVNLPDMESPEVLNALKKIKPEVPVIVLAGIAEIEIAVELVKNGAADYISKPFKVDALVELARKTRPPVPKVLPAAAPENGKDVPEKKEVKPDPRKGEGEQKKGKKTKLPIPVLAGAGVLLVAVAAALLLKPQSEGSGIKEFVVSLSSPSAFFVEPDSMLVSDLETDTIYQFARDAAFSLVDKYPLPVIMPSGMTSDKKNLWISNSLEGKIYRLSINTKTVLSSYDSPGPSPSGLYYDGTFLWSLDFQQSKVYKHALDDKLTVLASFESPAKNPRSMYGYKNTLFVADTSTNQIIKINDRGAVESTYTLPSIENKTLPLAAIACDGKFLWAGFEGVPKIFCYRMKDLKSAKP